MGLFLTLGIRVGDKLVALEKSDMECEVLDNDIGVKYKGKEYSLFDITRLLTENENIITWIHQTKTIQKTLTPYFNDKSVLVDIFSHISGKDILLQIFKGVNKGICMTAVPRKDGVIPIYL